ncbi:MAG: carbon starvation protein A [Spirochaetales bacterium]|nr:carbon starvation protein A [Spirochaetales bacterium]
MNASLAAALALLAYALGYWLYSGYLSRSVFGLRPDVATPAVRLNDGVDYVPTNPWVLFGHHYASIAGLAPMLGPAVAVIWGWLPALIWVVLGALFIGCVHDFGSMVVSLRARGRSIGMVAEGIMGRRAKTLFHLIIFFLVALAMGVFVYVIALLFSPAPTPEDAAVHFPQAVLPSAALMVIAALMGFLHYRRGLPWKILAPIGFALTLLFTYVGQRPDVVSFTGLDVHGYAPDVQGWSFILLGYAFLASVLPVWSLLQPRDFLNSLLLYLGLIALYGGLFLLSPEFTAPAFRANPEGAPSIFPAVFIIIACGAASGFHSLVSSGTTAKQIARETHARPIGYGGMIGESLLGLLAVLATTAGIMSDQWEVRYASWKSMGGLGAQIGVFIQGCGTFLSAWGIDPYLGSSFVSLIVVSYALTSLDSATRLLRYNIEEMAESARIPLPQGVYRSLITGSMAVAAIAFFAFYRINGKAAGLALWELFGTTNQLLAALALLVVSLYLYQRRRNYLVALVPMLFLLVATVHSMWENIQKFWDHKEWPLFVVGAALLGLAAWLILEAIATARRFKKSNPETEPDILV